MFITVFDLTVKECVFVFKQKLQFTQINRTVNTKIIYVHSNCVK